MALGWAGWHGWRQWSPLDRAGALVVVPGLTAFWWAAIGAIMGAPAIDWNGARLAPTAALVRGYALYYPATSGPILSTVYGPLAAFAFLPAALFRTPTAAVLCAAALTVAYVTLPLLVWGWRTRPPHPTGGLLAIVCWLGSCALLLRGRAGTMWLTFVHPDAPALACGLLACAVLWPGDADRVPTTRRTWAAGALATASVAMKQLSAPLPLALGLYVWAGYGWRRAIDFVASGLVLTGVVSLLAVATSGVDATIFNTVTIVTRQPWLYPGVRGLVIVGTTLAVEAAGSAAIVAGAAVCDLVAGRRAVGTWRTWLRARPWTATLAIAVALFPAGILGCIKLGGDQNSFYSLYFLAAAAGGALAWNAGTLSRPGWRRAFRVLCFFYCLGNAAFTWSAGGYGRWERRVSPWANRNQEAYAFMRRHPGEAYFPWYPLAGLLAEQRLYHFEYGILDRFLAGFEPTREHVLAHVPPHMHLLVSGQKPWILHDFPDYTEERRTPELPGWILFAPPASG